MHSGSSCGTEAVYFLRCQVVEALDYESTVDGSELKMELGDISSYEGPEELVKPAVFIDRPLYY